MMRNNQVGFTFYVTFGRDISKDAFNNEPPMGKTKAM
jgi:hypothetical protein